MMSKHLIKLGTIVRNAFTNYPIMTNSIVYGTLFVGAEFSQQTLTRKILTDIPKDYDLNSVKRYGITGTFLYSPLLTLWYKWLDKRYIGTTYRIISRKLLLDQFLFTPPLLALFFIVMSTLEQKKDIFEECRMKFVPTFKTSCLFWLPAQTINFLIIPPIYRVTYIASCAFAWVNILCYIKRNEY